MKPILNLSGHRVEVNALFIQPTRWCGLNCKGCYVKEHSGGEDGFHTPWQEQLSLFRKFYRGVDAWANQITVSLDDLPKTLGMSAQMSHMLLLAESILDEIKNDKRAKEDRPEVHFTCHTIHTLAEYFPTMTWDQFHLLSMVSYSELPVKELGFIEIYRELYPKFMGTLINYNMMIPKYNPANMDWNKEAAYIWKATQLVDHIYMVMFKTPVGGTRDLNVRIADTNRMASDIMYIKNVLERLPQDAKSKITTDGCLSDTAQFVRDQKFGCSSNVSRFQVWPDGTVSGCPYAFNGDGKLGKTAEDILENIKAARKKYDFRDKCHLPQVYTSLTRQRGTQQLTQASG